MLRHAVSRLASRGVVGLGGHRGVDVGVRWHGAAPFAAAGAGTTAVAALSLTRGALIPAIARRTAAVVA
eukprot:CAMPEP_0181378556 /NCGR_PEP_ID=MMETSP1106-20121128/18526_1 /TAXON_ID=81844 /ORGANISM="Mantoniella antarctica, Strain SL-175" /LENGTH=68 /DNA_ID=CAMNT_0023497431 /DNA_START=169 /DNA_END=372 /DNA_ORIENTATION=-